MDVDQTTNPVPVNSSTLRSRAFRQRQKLMNLNSSYLESQPESSDVATTISPNDTSSSSILREQQSIPASTIRSRKWRERNRMLAQLQTQSSDDHSDSLSDPIQTADSITSNSVSSVPNYCNNLPVPTTPPSTKRTRKWREKQRIALEAVTPTQLSLPEIQPIMSQSPNHMEVTIALQSEEVESSLWD
ncbi:hypothetical protein HOY82DRAFT_537414 [Tuber indicum]|nr:hypothetical protein HOY82DRAFT_537414 [Tuber indicum]